MERNQQPERIMVEVRPTPDLKAYMWLTEKQYERFSELIDQYKKTLDPQTKYKLDPEMKYKLACQAKNEFPENPSTETEAQ